MKFTLRTLFLTSIAWLRIYATEVVHRIEPIASPDVLVTASRQPDSINRIGMSVEILNQDQIAASSAVNLAQILKQVPGLHLRNNGGIGSAASLSIRGIEPKYVLVLLDGMDLSDPLGNGGDRQAVIHDFALDEIDRIEIVKGSQSTLWGSDAIGGVVNIITKKTKKSDLDSFSIITEVGTHKYVKNSFSSSGSENKFSYRFRVTKEDFGGFSAANENRGNTEKDGYSGRNMMIKLDFEHNQRSNTDLLYSYNHSDLDTDGGFVLPIDNQDSFSSRHRHFLLQHTHLSSDGEFEQNFGLKNSSFETINRSFAISEFHGGITQLFYKGNLVLSNHSLSFGLESEEDRGKSLQDPLYSSRTNAIFVQDRIELNRNFDLSVGARLDHHSSFKDAVSYRVSPSYRIGKNHFKASLSTGFKAPTLYQLNAVATAPRHFDYLTPAPLVRFSNKNLKPTKSKSWEIGFERELSDELALSITYFKQSLSDAILFVFDSVGFTGPFGFVNQDNLDSNGLEYKLDWQINKRLDFSFHHLQVASINRLSGLQLRRQPRSSNWLEVSYRHPKHYLISLHAREVSDQIESYQTAFAAQRNLDSYRVYDLAIQKKFNEHWKVNLDVQNLMNTQYEEVFGFGTGGRMLRVSLERKF